jgi:predicted metal-dependent peptidase
MAMSPFEDITQRWFITEPALFATYCTHHLEENATMACAIRCGRGVIEYNPSKMPKSYDEREELLRTEVVRIMLRHPYERQPINVRKRAIGIASDMVISDNMPLKYAHLPKPQDFGLERNRHFEWYADEIDALLMEMHGGDDGEDNAETTKGDAMSQEASGNGEGEGDSQAEKVENWEEDDFMATEISETLKQVRDWGTMPGSLVQGIKANLEAKMDYRRALAGFRASVFTSSRSLTRMRPNRRFEFDAMGSKYNLTSNLLIAVDVSGSVGDKMLGNFFGVLSRFFKYGVVNLDIIQFDARIQGVVQKMGKRFRPSDSIKISGRGGTDYQPVIDYLKDNKQYDGLIIFTDGYAPEPKLDFHTRTKILWACESESSYNNHHKWMEKTGRACFIETR